MLGFLLLKINWSNLVFIINLFLMRLLFLMLIFSFTVFSQRNAKKLPDQFDSLVLLQDSIIPTLIFEKDTILVLKLLNNSNKTITHILTPENENHYKNDRVVCSYSINKNTLNPNEIMTVKARLNGPIDFFKRILFNLFFKVDGNERRKLVEQKFSVTDPKISITYLNGESIGPIQVDSTKIFQFYIEVPGSKSKELNVWIRENYHLNGFKKGYPDEHYWIEQNITKINTNKSLVTYKVKNIYGDIGSFNIDVLVNLSLYEPYVKPESFNLSFKGSFTGNKKDTTIIERKEFTAHEFTYKKGKLNSFKQLSPVKALELFGGPFIQFDSIVANYGKIEKWSNGKRSFTFTNIGTEPLILFNVKSSCGCLVANWPKNPINPGERGVIEANYATNRVGKINKSLTVLSNSINKPTIVLKIKGSVFDPIKKLGEETIKTDTNRIDFGNIKKGESILKEVMFKNISKTSVFIDSVVVNNKQTDIKFTPTQLKSGDSTKIIVTYQFSIEEKLDYDKNIWGGVLIYGRKEDKPFIYDKLHFNGIVKKDN